MVPAPFPFVQPGGVPSAAAEERVPWCKSKHSICIPCAEHYEKLEREVRRVILAAKAQPGTLAERLIVRALEPIVEERPA